MMSNSGSNHNLTGDAIRADSYYGRTDGIHTVQAVYSNFTGNFGLQGTLAVEPTESDWFDINLNANRNVSSASPYVTFPQSQNNVLPGNTGETGTMAFTFVGNFTHLRAVIDRSSIPEPPATLVYPYGMVDKVLLSM